MKNATLSETVTIRMTLSALRCVDCTIPVKQDIHFQLEDSELYATRYRSVFGRQKIMYYRLWVDGYVEKFSREEFFKMAEDFMVGHMHYAREA